MDVTTYPVWNGAIVALLADVTNQPENTAAPTSELLANPRMFNVCDGAKSRQNPNSTLLAQLKFALHPRLTHLLSRRSKQNKQRRLLEQ